MGYICAPHTSAGRIPTEKGYRYYIDSLLRVRQLSHSDQQRIEGNYRIKGLRMEEVLREAGKVLSSISHYTGLVLAPRLYSTVFRHIEFVRLSSGRILVILVTQSGIVQNKLIETDRGSQPERTRADEQLSQSDPLRPDDSGGQGPHRAGNGRGESTI